MIFVIKFSSKLYWSFKNNIKLIENIYISLSLSIYITFNLFLN
jgi:hypothetical protein